MKCLIIDADQKASKKAKSVIEKIPEITTAKKFTTVRDALPIIKDEVIDLIIMDQHMTGINLLEILNQQSFFPHLILTGEAENVETDLFENQISDYIHKPIMESALRLAIDNIIGLMEMGPDPQTVEEIYVRNSTKLVKIDYKDILYIENAGDYAKVVTPIGSHITRGTIKNISCKLPKTQFLKVHRSFIVNLRKIIDIEANSLQIGEKIIPVSRAHKHMLMSKLNVL